MYKKAILRFLSLTVLFFSIIMNGKTQDLLRSYDLSTIKVDKLSDADIAKFKQQLAASGLTQDQAEQLAIAKGMPIAEVQKLRMRVQMINTPGNATQNPYTNNQPNNLSGYRNNSQDTSANRFYGTDTTRRRPFINPRIFGSELFNNQTLNIHS